jgi:hypothetical protein
MVTSVTKDALSVQVTGAGTSSDGDGGVSMGVSFLQEASNKVNVITMKMVFFIPAPC